MELYLLDDAFRPVCVIDDFASLIWRRRYDKPGEFELHCSPDRARDLLRAGYIYRHDRPETGIIESFRKKGSSVVVSGRFLEALLDSEIVYPRREYSGCSSEYIADDLVAQFLPQLPRAPVVDGGRGTPVSASLLGENLCEYIYELLGAQEYAPRITYDYATDALLFSVWQGLDRRQSQSDNSWAVFSANWENLLEAEYSISRKDLRNYAVIAGGSEEDRTFHILDRSDGDVPRRLFLDVSTRKGEDMTDEEYIAVLEEKGLEKLAKYKAVEKFDVTIDHRANLRYMTDFDLGDFCTVIDTDLGITLDARLLEIEEDWEDGDMTLVARFGEGFLTVPDYIRRRYG